MDNKYPNADEIIRYVRDNTEEIAESFAKERNLPEKSSVGEILDTKTDSKYRSLFDEMFTEMNYKNQEIFDEEIVETLENCEIGYIDECVKKIDGVLSRHKDFENLTKILVDVLIDESRNDSTKYNTMNILRKKLFPVLK